MDRKSWIVIVALAIGLVAAQAAVAGPPIWIAGGNMGQINNIDSLGKSQFHGQAVAASARLLGAAKHELRPSKSWTDSVGNTHVKMQQRLNGMDVVGGDTILHVRGNGKIYALGGGFTRGARTPAKAKLGRDEAIAAALGELGQLGADIDSVGGLTYVVDERTGGVSLAYSVGIRYSNNYGPQHDIVYANARKAGYAAVDPQIHYALDRRTYDSQDSNTQGVLVCADNVVGYNNTCPDAASQDAHDYAGVTYDYYNTKFGRDSLDDAGLTLISSVHFCSGGCPYANAGWTGAQMIYGDGGSFGWDYMSKALDVVAHELTHGVTDFTSDLRYRNESGALNESMSDIFGEAAEIWAGKSPIGEWDLGEDLGGDILRYMDNPTLDGYSVDWYPNKLGGGGDNGGVHGNSGISNLAFVLLVEGGTHPRGLSPEVVPQIGLQAAEDIFYLANTSYFSSGTNFAAAASLTEQAANDLFSSTEADAVHSAWCAVGVISCDGGTGGTCTDLLPAGASCTANAECCSNNCKGGGPNGKTCK